MNNVFIYHNNHKLVFRQAIDREALKEASEKASGGFYLVAAAANEVANTAMANADLYLRQHDYLKCREGRRWIRQAMRNYDDYERAVRCKLKDYSRSSGRKAATGDYYSLWLDITDNVDEETRPHIQKLFYAVKLQLDRIKDVRETEALAHLWTASMLIDIAVTVFDRVFESVEKRWGINFAHIYKIGRLDGTQKCWRKVTEAYDRMFTPKGDNREIRLGDDPSVVNGVRALSNILLSTALYERGGAIGIRSHQDLFTDEERAEMAEALDHAAR